MEKIVEIWDWILVRRALKRELAEIKVKYKSSQKLVSDTAKYSSKLEASVKERDQKINSLNIAIVTAGSNVSKERFDREKVLSSQKREISLLKLKINMKSTD